MSLVTFVWMEREGGLLYWVVVFVFVYLRFGGNVWTVGLGFNRRLRLAIRVDVLVLPGPSIMLGSTIL